MLKLVQVLHYIYIVVKENLISNCKRLELMNLSCKNQIKQISSFKHIHVSICVSFLT